MDPARKVFDVLSRGARIIIGLGGFPTHWLSQETIGGAVTGPEVSDDSCYWSDRSKCEQIRSEWTRWSRPGRFMCLSSVETMSVSGSTVGVCLEKRLKLEGVVDLNTVLAMFEAGTLPWASCLTLDHPAGAVEG
ncbi:hypothetical protein RRG08_025990 [Elysia crispata]|uniref:Uncharacterized protein n=1 Tax=Elysia crispata TaxID=231223 RepID=A0AAE0ZI11_9GAST|nr:hypothetical protein RRG08_025990 [Elysia crispata]